MSDRSLAVIDEQLSAAVKTRDNARARISQLSDAIISATRQIDALLAERCSHNVCPDTVAELVEAP